MSSEWRNVRLEEVTSILGDGLHGTPAYDDDGDYHFINGSNLSNGEIAISEATKRLNFAEFEKHRKNLGDRTILVSINGTLGNVALYKGEKVVLGKSACYFNVLNSVDKHFVRYVVASELFQTYISNLATGSTIKNVSLRLMRDFPFTLPPLDVQQRIAGILKCLDDRITLLRETNATLEAIAQALFKSWFVDFDPVRAKMEGRAPEGMDEATAALFPDGFEASELGLVPRGWSVMPFGGVCSVTIGGLWGKDTQEDAELIPAISLRGVDLEHLRMNGFAKDAPLRWVKPSAIEKRQLKESEVLVASSGAGPCGRSLWAGAPFEAMYGMPVIFSNFVKRLECGTPARAIFVDRLLSDMRDSREIWNYINGTSIPNLDDKLLLATKKVVMPSDAVLSAFEDTARAIYAKLYSQQAQTLATLRDTLLPRLISGQLRLPDFDAEPKPLELAA